MRQAAESGKFGYIGKFLAVFTNHFGCSIELVCTEECVWRQTGKFFDLIEKFGTANGERVKQRHQIELGVAQVRVWKSATRCPELMTTRPTQTFSGGLVTD